jgi:hypothetical protein
MNTNKSYPLRLLSLFGNPSKQRGFTPAKGLLAMALVFAVLALAPACPAYACSCIPPAPPKESLADAAAVFSGEVTEVVLPGGGVVNTAEMIEVNFKVDQVWKGEIAELTTVTTAGSSASCGFEFQSGQSYIVYAYLVDGQLNASLCSRTAALENAGEDLEALGEGAAPTPAVSQPEPYPLPGDPTATPIPAPGAGAPGEPGISRLEWVGIGGVAAAVVGVGLLLVVFFTRPRK